MSDGITVSGWDEMVSYIEGLEISEQLERKALTSAGAFLENRVKDYIKANVELTGYTRETTKGKIKKVNGDAVFSLALVGWDAHFINFGTSKSKDHVGFFERETENRLDEVKDRITKVISEVF